MSLIQQLPHDVRRTIYSIVKRKSFVRSQESRKLLNSNYTFKSFDDTRSIFIHIPKAAGVSVCKSLYGNLAGGHTSASSYQYVFSKKDFYSYFKFTFVRNPWDRLYSAYTFLKNGGLNEGDSNWALANLSQFGSFEQFVMEGVMTKNIKKWLHFIPQTDLLLLPGTSIIPVDFLGFFENIEDDFNYVAGKVGKNISLSHLNKGKQKCPFYMKQYNNDMISIVEKVYETDIDTFGYSFDNSTLHNQLTKRSKGQLFAAL